MSIPSSFLFPSPDLPHPPQTCITNAVLSLGEQCTVFLSFSAQKLGAKFSSSSIFVPFVSCRVFTVFPVLLPGLTLLHCLDQPLEVFSELSLFILLLWLSILFIEEKHFPNVFTMTPCHVEQQLEFSA